MSKEIDWSKAPEGATHYLPESRDLGYQAMWYMHNGINWYCVAADFISPKSWTIDYAELDIFVPMLIQRPTFSEWNGAGLPPVGTVCEWTPRSTERRVVEILAYHGDEVWMKYRDHDNNTFTVANPAFFYPIRTPEQIAAEEREKAVNAMTEATQGAHNWAEAFGKLHDAGYRRVEDK